MFDLAIYYRMVGGFVSTGSTSLARWRWSLTLGAYMAFVTIVHHEGIVAMASVFVLCSIMAYVGRLIPHALFQASASLLNSLGMASVNIVRLFLVLVPYSVINWHTVYTSPVDTSFDVFSLALSALGIFAGVAYYVGNKWLDGKDVGIYFRNTHSQWRISEYAQPYGTTTSFLDQAAVLGSEWAELLTGWFVYELMFLIALVLP